MENTEMHEYTQTPETSVQQTEDNCTKQRWLLKDTNKQARP